MLRRRDQRLIEPGRLAELERLAEDGVRVRTALTALKPMRYQAMEVVRSGTAGEPEVERARGWLRCLDDLGEALITGEAADARRPANP